MGPDAGTALRFLATAIGARSVVEIGTGYGRSGVWLLRGMVEGALLTTVDIDPGCQRCARDTYRQAGFPANRARLICGRALDVLPRLRDDAYDLVFLDADRAESPAYLTEALRLLRPGGIVVCNDALAAEEAHGPTSEADPVADALRSVSRLVHEDDTLVPLLLPVGSGLLAAVRHT